MSEQKVEWDDRTVADVLHRRGQRQTLEQVGERYGITKERVRQIEHRAFHRVLDLDRELVPLLTPEARAFIKKKQAKAAKKKQRAGRA